jgi:seryl-tRNA synthetase
MITRTHVAAFMLLTTGATSPADAQVNPFAAVDSIVTWFERLNAHWNKFVSGEERRQLVKKVDDLRQKFAELSEQSRSVLENIPDKAPNAAKRQELGGQLDRLEQKLKQVDGDTIRLASALGISDADLPRANSDAVHSRTGAVHRLRDALADPHNWRAQELRQRLNAGLAAIAKAQSAATLFRNRLAKQS